MEQSDYDELFGVPSARGVGLEMLEYWLNKEFWNFNRGFNQFDGYSEGLCILAGIDPEQSNQTADEYGPVFLPLAQEGYGVTKISSENQWRVKESIDRYVDDLKSLGLKGRINCHDAIRASVEKGLSPFWLDAARSDKCCAKLLPSEVVHASCPPAMIENISNALLEGDAPSNNYSVSAKEKAHRRWENDDNKKLRADLGEEVLKMLLKENFDKCRAKNGKVEYTRIAREVRSHMREFVGDDAELPVEKTIVQDVKDFLNDRRIDVLKL